MRRSDLSPILAILVLIGSMFVACGSTDPLPSVTARPTDVPSADTGSRSALSDFEGRLRDATAREGLLIRTLASASVGSAADLRLAIAQMRDWADGERAWLAQQPSTTCYDPAVTKFRAALDAMASSASWFEGTIEASLAPSDDVSLGSMETEASNDLQDVTQALTDAAALAKAARATCT